MRFLTSDGSWPTEPGENAVFPPVPVLKDPEDGAGGWLGAAGGLRPSRSPPAGPRWPASAPQAASKDEARAAAS